MRAGSVIAAIGIGSNLGDRRLHIEGAMRALCRLPETLLVARGPVIAAAAVGRAGVDPGGEYLNSVALVRTRLRPLLLLRRLHAIERGHGRRREGVPAWSPRALDLDLLLYGERLIRLPMLSVPHPRMHERRFVLEPLSIVGRHLRVPGTDRNVRQLLADLDSKTAGALSDVSGVQPSQP